MVKKRYIDTRDIDSFCESLEELLGLRQTDEMVYYWEQSIALPNQNHGEEDVLGIKEKIEKNMGNITHILFYHIGHRKETTDGGLRNLVDLLIRDSELKRYIESKGFHIIHDNNEILGLKYKGEEIPEEVFETKCNLFSRFGKGERPDSAVNGYLFKIDILDVNYSYVYHPEILENLKCVAKIMGATDEEARCIVDDYNIEDITAYIYTAIVPIESISLDEGVSFADFIYNKYINTFVDYLKDKITHNEVMVFCKEGINIPENDILEVSPLEKILK